MDFSVGVLRGLLLSLVVMLLSLSVHEFAHALVADRLGDGTPRSQGRLTLSPLAHYDVFGTFLVPIFATLFSGAALIGWAKPVQVTPVNLTRRIPMRTGMALVAIAGPLSNLLLAIISIAVLAVLLRSNPAVLASPGPLGAGGQFLSHMFLTNVGLCVFNLIPLPPLDGSRLLPRRLDPLQEAIAPYSFVLILIILNVAALRVLFFTPVRLLAGGLESLFDTPLHLMRSG